MDIQHGFVGWKDVGRAADASSVVDFAEVFAWKRQKTSEAKTAACSCFRFVDVCKPVFKLPLWQR